MVEAYLGLGSNLGNKRENLRDALQRLGKEFRIVKVSSLYAAEPVGHKEQDWFLNAVTKIQAQVEPRRLLSYLLSTEQAMGRRRTVKQGPRIIDLDILFYGDLVIREDGLEIPHPRLHERMFVLAPLCEIAPDFVHPELKKTVRELKTSLSEPERVDLAEKDWW